MLKIEKKYKLLSEEPVETVIKGFPGRKFSLYRIVAEKSFFVTLPNGISIEIEKGSFGGQVSSEKNLSQEGSYWIFPNAIACDDAIVRDDAVLHDRSIVLDNAIIRDRAIISENAVVKNSAVISGFATVSGNTMISDSAFVCDHALISDDAKVEENAYVGGRSIVMGLCTVSNNAHVSGLSIVRMGGEISDNAKICNVTIDDLSFVCGNAVINPNYNITIYGNSHISSPITYLCDEKVVFSNFIIEDAEIEGPDDAYVIPVGYSPLTNGYFLRCNSRNGVKFSPGNSPRRVQLDTETLKKEGLKAFEEYKKKNPSAVKYIEPFIVWLRKYDVNSPSSLSYLVENIKEKIRCFYPGIDTKNFPTTAVISYLELNLIMLALMLKSTFGNGEKYSKSIINLIVKNSSIDIRTKEIIDFDEIVFLDKNLLSFILRACHIKEIPVLSSKVLEGAIGLVS